MADQDHLLRTTNSTTALGNTLTHQILSFLNTVSDQPLGFRPLAQDFLAISRILNTLESHLNSSPLPPAAIPELVKVLDQTLADFTQLKYLLEKFMKYEEGGTFAMLQKTWRMFVADKDIARVRNGLQASKGALTMTMLLTNINPTSSTTPVGYEYGILAAKLEHPEGYHPSPSAAAHGASGTPGYDTNYYAAPPAGPPLGFQNQPGGSYAPPSDQNIPPSSVLVERKLVPIPTYETGALSSTSHSSQGILTPSISEMTLSDSATEHSLSLPLVEEHVPVVKQPLIRISPDLSKVPRRVPQNPSGSNNKALQKTLVTAVSAHKPTIVEQLLNRGVSPNTDPAQNALIAAAYGRDLTSLRLLLEFGGDPNISAADGNTPLRVACQHGHEDEAKLLLEYGASPNGLTPAWTALAWALDGGYEGIIRLLLQYGTDPNATMQNGETTLVYACGKRHQGIPKMIQEIIEYGADVNGKTGNGKTALYYACEDNRSDIVQLLLSSGADPNLPGPNFPIEASYRHPECMKLLLSSGADVHAKKEFMEKAVCQDCIEVIQQFLDAGVDPNSKTNDYWSPLTTAIRDNREEIMALLLFRGADPNLKGEDFPLMMAVDKPALLKQLLSAGADIKQCKGLLEKAVYREQEESIRILLEAGEPINGVDGDYYRPICTAVRDNRPELLSLLLSKGTDPNLAGGEGVPLMIAANKPQMLQQLLKAGADPKKAKGVLEKAVYLNCIEAVHILLDAGVDINGGKDDYYRPLTTAVRDQHPDILALLLERGADPDSAGGEGKPLMIAANKPAMIKQLLAGGADARTDLGGLMEKAVYLNSIESIPILVEAGAYINGGKDDYYRPLNTAVRDNRVDHLKKLLELGADPNVAGGEGIPLTMAARQEDGTSLQILLDGGAEVNKTHNAWTALMCACERNLPENVRMLMRRGADVNMLNGSGNSAMDIAANAGHDDIVMILLEVM